MKKIAILLIAVFVLTACGETTYKVGQVVNTSAKITRKTYEHPIDPPTGYDFAAYVRLNGDETILYSQEPMKCALGETIEFEARVRDAKGVPFEQTEEVKETHFVVKEFKCKGDVKEREHADEVESFAIKDLFKDKVVYGTDLTNVAPYKEDCDLRGGTFNECGSPCAPDAEVCIEVCAYTCDF